jgi:hypothetical protein
VEDCLSFKLQWRIVKGKENAQTIAHKQKLYGLEFQAISLPWLCVIMDASIFLKYDYNNIAQRHANQRRVAVGTKCRAARRLPFLSITKIIFHNESCLKSVLQTA